jgi:hypothetical protein
MSVRHIAIASVLATALGAAGAHVATRVTLPRATHVHLGPLKHSWPDLSRDQLERLAAALPYVKGTRVEIYCNGAACSDLAHDLDDTIQDAGAESSIERSWHSMGSGIGISPDDARSQAVARAIKEATGGAISPQVVPMDMTAACALPMTFEKVATNEPANAGSGTGKETWHRVPDEEKLTAEHRACLGRIVIAIGAPLRS